MRRFTRPCATPRTAAIGCRAPEDARMLYRRLGNSDLNVSEIALGSWLTYGGGVQRAEAEACVQRAFDAGINFLDTANVYAEGGAETFLGEGLQRRPRDRSEE